MPLPLLPFAPLDARIIASAKADEDDVVAVGAAAAVDEYEPDIAAEEANDEGAIEAAIAARDAFALLR